MPTYEYECQKCKKRHDIFQSITAKALTKCPKCSGKMKRLLGTGSGFLFKGSGFYITDYRSKKYTDAKKKDEQSSKPAAKSSDAGSSSAKSDSKGSAPSSK